jgi:hypothetical protein
MFIRNLFTIAETARRLGIPPRKISDMFYNGKLDETKCVLIGGRRFIPSDYVSTVEQAVGSAGSHAPARESSPCS